MQLTEKTKHLTKQLDKSTLSKFSDKIFIIDETEITHPPTSIDKCIVVCKENLEPKDILELVWNNGVKHIIQESHGQLESEIIIAGQIIDSVDLFIKNPLKGFNLKQKNFSYTLTKTKQKNELKNKVTEFIKSVPALGLLSDAINVILDEFYMNAFYDAPTDEKQTHIYANLPRTEQIELKDNQAIDFFISYNKDEVVIGCHDPFGSFDEQKFLKNFYSNYANEQSVVNMGSGGAGIGCRMIFEYSSSVYFTSIKNKETLVCSKLYTYQNGNTPESAPKNFHVSIK